MKTVCFFLVSCAIFVPSKGTPQVFYTPFARNFNSSARQYYAVEYLGNSQQQQPGQDYNLNHGEVDAPQNDDDILDENMENMFYNGFAEISNDEEIDLSVMPYDENPEESIFVGDNMPDDFEDDEDTQGEVAGEKGNENQSNLGTKANETISSEESMTEEDLENSTEVGNYDNNNSSSTTTDMPDNINSTFVHPIHRPSSEWPLEAIQMADANSFNNPEEDGETMKDPKRRRKPQQGYRKRIRVYKRRRGSKRRPSRPLRNVRVRKPTFRRRGASSSTSRSCGNCQCGVTTTRRLEDGEVSAVNEFPWSALITFNDTIQCQGTLISDRYVLTAAHCVRGFDIKLLQLRFIEYNTERSTDTVLVLRRIARIYSHKSYVAKISDNDIAILRLSRPIKFETTTVRPICLPPNAMDLTGKTGIIAGLGTAMEWSNSSNIIKKTKVPIISNQQCLLIGMKITSNMLCAGRLLDGGIDACQGDSGGPLMVVRNKRYHLAGVISWGDGCAKPLKPGIYTRVTKYLPWINKKITGSCKCTR